MSVVCKIRMGSHRDFEILVCELFCRFLLTMIFIGTLFVSVFLVPNFQMCIVENDVNVIIANIGFNNA